MLKAISRRAVHNHKRTFIFNVGDFLRRKAGTVKNQ